MLRDLEAAVAARQTDCLLWSSCGCVAGLIVSTDVTDILNFGYFPSFNRAYSPEIVQVSGAAAMIAQHGPSFSFFGSAR